MKVFDQFPDRFKRLPVLTPPVDIPDIMHRLLWIALDENPDLGQSSEFHLRQISEDEFNGTPMAVGAAGREYEPSVHVVIDYDVDYLSRLSTDEIDEALRHELSHVKNGDCGPYLTPHIRNARRKFCSGKITWADYNYVLKTESTTASRHTNKCAEKMDELLADVTLSKNPAAIIPLFKKVRGMIGLRGELALLLTRDHPTMTARIHNLQRFQKRRQLKTPTR